MSLCPLKGARAFAQVLGVIIAVQSGYVFKTSYEEAPKVDVQMFPYLDPILKGMFFVSICHIASVVLLFALPPSKGRVISKAYQLTALILICVTVVTLLFV